LGLTWKKKTQLLDDITKAFIDISPEDFLRETSAVKSVDYPPAAIRLGLSQGRDNFNRFVEANLESCRADAAHEHGFHSFSALSSHDKQRHFRPDDDETPVDYAKRLARESAQMDATWYFTAMVAPGRSFTGEVTPQDLDLDDLDAIDRALNDGELSVGICWSAGCREVAESAYRGGILYLDADGLVANEVEGELDPSTDAFHAILEG
jgi:hypothetical protein